jgi:V8-like Glu-specific endopeptidase
LQPGEGLGKVSRSKSGKGYPFTTSRVNPKVVTSWPHRLAGKVFFKDPGNGKNYVCSGAILARRLILTAGHCLYNRAGNYFHTNHIFVPAYDATRSFQPYGIWSRGYAIVPSQWANSSGFPTSADFGIFAVRDRYIASTYRKIGEYLGWFGWQTYRLNGNQVKALGYPGNLDSGGRMAQTDAQVYYRTSYAGEIGTSQSGGSSGGAWVQDFGIRSAGQQLINSTGSNRIVGVTSYGPTNFNPWQYAGASVLNSHFVRIRNSACNAGTSNC